ncbi:hypothetical protein PSACC_01941 [Paramicrosporidium saccamoebae]|uniref:DUF1688-domain-containing protein n=1 Tax=Paramicrosporidium saccamoebae TaxID=1246581 RepID=A0A2H9TKR0_9FUNG|nr:hypothetical protein PSACC_01941 [Paramicrosporidium saccamoebae]
MPAEMKDTVEYLQSLAAVRERCEAVLELGLADKLECFSVRLDKLPEAAEMITKLIIRDYGNVGPAEVDSTIANIPPHGRWRHFGAENVERLIKELEVALNGDKIKITTSMLDLFIVAVLLDAGAGDAWKYNDNGKTIVRSEGLAVAALRMFQSGLFSSSEKLRVDSRGLKNLKESDLVAGFQVSQDNPLLGVGGRLALLHQLGNVIEKQTQYFPKDSEGFSRPGALVEYLTTKQSAKSQVHIDVFWDLVINGFGGVWPESRTKLNGVSLGDVWPCAVLGCLIPFHKLSQWLSYSLMEPISYFLGIEFVNAEKMTGLAEYRNGGLFVDLSIITLKESAKKYGIQSADFSVPTFAPDSPVIVEWRALTVALIDRLAILMRSQLKVNAECLPLPKLLEAGTWKAGREIAKQLRPGGGPPIALLSDGTLF